MGYLNGFEKTIFSQSGEDGITLELISLINPPSTFLEFGVQNGKQCNTRSLKELGWSGVWWDGSFKDEAIGLHQEFITAENINDLIAKYHVPTDLGVLSIDIDGNDFHVWKAIHNKFRPHIVIIEYNPIIAPGICKSIPYNKDHVWDGSDYYGASFSALVSLGHKKGYVPVATNHIGVNLFFVRADHLPLLPSALQDECKTPEALYNPCRWGGHPVDGLARPWIDPM